MGILDKGGRKERLGATDGAIWTEVQHVLETPFSLRGTLAWPFDDAVRAATSPMVTHKPAPGKAEVAASSSTRDPETGNADGKVEALQQKLKNLKEKKAASVAAGDEEKTA